ncbi:hypothetical protein D0856_28645 [Vibrio owensii]|uniref:hypothetical protein n=1 Tax=Vibrio owensii TaxID=696485 RepID=UPI000EFA3D4F|nr:hypothetical protein [Vibrio owensii]AYO23796.1 hypothetical protein D0856_28645 [Vibrio owensii]
MANNILSFSDHKKASTNQPDKDRIQSRNALIIELLEIFSSAGVDLDPLYQAFLADAKLK